MSLSILEFNFPLVPFDLSIYLTQVACIFQSAYIYLSIIL